MVANVGSSKYYQNNLLVLDNSLLGEGDCPVHCKMFHSNLDLDPLHASSTPIHDNQKCLMTLLSVAREGKSDPVENHCFTSN